MPFFMPLFGRGAGASFVTADRATVANAFRPFPAGAGIGDVAIAYFGARDQPRLQSGGTTWAQAIPGAGYAFTRRLTAGDLASGYRPDEEVILGIYRGASAALYVTGDGGGQGPTAQLGGFNRAPGHVGIVAFMFGAAPLNSGGEIGAPVGPAPFAQRIFGGYLGSATNFTTGLWDRLSPEYVNGTPITWEPSASNGNGISIFQLVA